ncbi:MAG: NAD(+) diphosphatase [Actinomycetia bacterium]|nr:NAD(+) diphosphatase [Actinomycetes bacterium]
MPPAFTPGLASPQDVNRSRLWFATRGTEVLVRATGRAAEIPPVEALAALELEVYHYLGALGSTDCYAVGLADSESLPGGDGFHELLGLFGQLPDAHFAIAGRAVQVVEWDRTHCYCGRCGQQTVDEPGERAKRCTSCGQLAFPRISPAVIVRISRGDEILLAHGTRFPAAFYSVLAGFVEPGESLEETVAREVREEVGIEVKDVRYFGSQPWPFPNSLMVGFTAEYAGGELAPDPQELTDAQWFSVDDLPPVPPPLSIARWLIDDLVDKVTANRSSR